MVQQSTSVTAKKRPRQRCRPRNIDRRSTYDKWLYSMAKRPLYDLLPRNSEIHNFTSLHLTDRQAKVLGLGLKFRPTLKPPDLTQFNVQIQDFCRSVRLHKKFEGEPADPDFNPRLNVKSTWNPPREDPDLEDKLHEICKDYGKTSSKTSLTGAEISLLWIARKSIRSNVMKLSEFWLPIRISDQLWCQPIG